MLRKSLVCTALSVLALGLTGCASGPQVSGQGFSFGLWGDMPYKKAGDDPKLPAVLQSINQSDIAFSIYDGDIKDGSSQCTNEIYTDALKISARETVNAFRKRAAQLCITRSRIAERLAALANPQETP